MSVSPSDRRKLTRDLRAIFADGVLYNGMVGFGETYVSAFVLALGHGDTVAGLVATLPILFGSVLQMGTPYGARRFGSFRRWTMFCAIVQAGSLAPFIIGAHRGQLGTAWIFAAATIYWAAGLGAGPTWNVWVGALIPRRLRGPFFARRARWMHFTLLLSMLTAGWLLHGLRGTPGEPQMFALLFLLAMFARAASCTALALTRDVGEATAPQRVLNPPAALRALRSAEGGRLLFYLLAAQGAAHIAAPYFTPYMLGSLNLSYGRFTLLTATAFAARMAVLPLMARLAKRWGVHRVLLLGGLGITPIPLLWLFSDQYAYLLLLQTLAGTAWAALEFGTLMSFFEVLEERYRVSVLSFYNLANSVVVALGSVVGALLLQAADSSAGGYVMIFAASCAARAVALPLLLRARRPLPAPAQVVLRTLAVRPSAGAIQRVVLPTLEAERGADGTAGGAA